MHLGIPCELQPLDKQVEKDYCMRISQLLFEDFFPNLKMTYKQHRRKRK